MNADTLLYRQVNPLWIQNGEITSQVFRPTRKDEKRLSVYDGDQITPVEAWCHFTNHLGHASAGVVAVTVADCRNLGLPVRPEPSRFPEHAVIDFTEFSGSAIKRKADSLKEAARSRGWLLRPDGSF